MNKKLYSGASLLLIAIAFLSFSVVNNMLFGNVKLDLTENSLYTLSDGSREILGSIDEPVNLYFFFSGKASEDLASLRTYAVRVRELLEQYESLGSGKIKLNIIDPEPFSEDEDRASGFGLQAIPVNSGNELYFGLAGTNAMDGEEVIPFFQPDKEEFLEYEISRLVQSLAHPDKPVIGLMSSLEMSGGVDMQTFQATPAWVVVDQLGSLFEIQNVPLDVTEISPDIDVLMLVHPKALGEATQFAIDQFVMRGGRLLVFVDPLSEIDRPEQGSPMMALPSGQSSDLNKLLSAWGIRMREDVVVGDAQTALEVSGGASGQPVRHLAILGLQPDNLDPEDVTTASLANVNVSSAGILDIDADAGTRVQVLIQSSPYAMPLATDTLRIMASPEDLQQGFVPTGERYVMAARLSGSARSAFPAESVENAGAIASTDEMNVIVIADTDILSDRLWVQVRNFFGQRVTSPWANNGDFIVNAVDNLAGSSSLISVRSRGRYSRPFDVVQDLRREAEAQYLKSANDLQAQLSETESQLAALESERKENSLLGLSPEQEQTLERFLEEKLRIRKELRDVRHQLDRDIEALGSSLKFLNIFLLPLMLTLMLLMIHYLIERNE